MKKREQVDSIHTSYLTDIVLKLWILIKNVLSLLIDRYLDSIHASSSPHLLASLVGRTEA